MVHFFVTGFEWVFLTLDPEVCFDVPLSRRVVEGATTPVRFCVDPEVLIACFNIINSVLGETFFGGAHSIQNPTPESIPLVSHSSSSLDPQYLISHHVSDIRGI